LTNPAPLPFDQRFSPEMKFLFAAARPFMTEDEGRGLRDLSASVRDWREFAALIQRHRLPGLVFANLKRFARDELPPLLYQSLRQQAKRNRLREMAACAEITRLNRMLRAKNIPVIFLKGPPLSMQLYGGLGFRHSRDLDILIPPKDIDAATQALKANGYKLQDENSIPAIRQRRAFLHWFHHFEYINPANGDLLELHWKLMENSFLLLPGFEQTAMERAASMDFGNETINVLSWPDNFLYLCAHGANHGWFRLKWLCDIAAFFRHPQTHDWERVAAETSRLGLERPVAQAAELSNRLLGAPVPGPMRTVCLRTVPLLAQLVESAEGFILKSETEYYAKGKFNRVSSGLYLVKLRKEWKFKLQTLAQTWIVKKDWDEFPLPDSLFFLYFFLHPFLWLRRCFGRGRARQAKP